MHVPATARTIAVFAGYTPEESRTDEQQAVAPPRSRARRRGRHGPAEGRLKPPHLCPWTHVLAWVRDERPMEERAPRPRLG